MSIEHFIKLFHFLVTGDLFVEEFVLFYLLLDKIHDSWVQAVLLENVQLLSTNFTFTADRLSHLQKFRHVDVSFIPKFLSISVILRLTSSF